MNRCLFAACKSWDQILCTKGVRTGMRYVRSMWVLFLSCFEGTSKRGFCFFEEFEKKILLIERDQNGKNLWRIRRVSVRNNNIGRPLRVAHFFGDLFFSVTCRQSPGSRNRSHCFWNSFGTMFRISSFWNFGYRDVSVWLALLTINCTILLIANFILEINLDRDPEKSNLLLVNGTTSCKLDFYLP